ncbi:MAG: hypothetical protein M1812_005927 [Candelaria pacifica]|nr:MAG: hypothetical protein M1812_005927 [Candelaria pacifica]
MLFLNTLTILASLFPLLINGNWNNCKCQDASNSQRDDWTEKCCFDKAGEFVGNWVYEYSDGDNIYVDNENLTPEQIDWYETYNQGEPVIYQNRPDEYSQVS